MPKSERTRLRREHRLRQQLKISTLLQPAHSCGRANRFETLKWTPARPAILHKFWLPFNQNCPAQRHTRTARPAPPPRKSNRHLAPGMTVYPPTADFDDPLARFQNIATDAYHYLLRSRSRRSILPAQEPFELSLGFDIVAQVRRAH